MTPKRSLVRMALAVSATLVPAAAQTPLFNDGAQFGGSKVFSEGVNPLGNPARFDRSPSGWYLSIVDGDQRAKDNASLLQDTTSSDPAVVTAALGKLGDSQWALRTRGYGIAGVKDGMNFGFTQEEFHSLMAYPDVAPADLGSSAALARNRTFADGRRTSVDRINFGGGALASGTSFGYNFRMERWSMGTITPCLNQPAGVNSFAFPGTFPYLYSMDTYVMDYSTTTLRTTSWALDLGFTTDLAQGVRIGAMVDQLNSKLLWDVQMKPQVRAALQLDLGANTTLTVESDVNGVERMPFPVKQQSSSASLRYQVSPAVIFQVGGERRKIGGTDVTRLGAALQLRTPSFLISFGFQAGQDRPLKGLSLMVN